MSLKSVDPYYPFDNLWIDVFAWRFILNENILLWLTTSYQEPFVFSVSAICFQIFTLNEFYGPKWLWQMQFV